ncbi:MAG: DUF922 domain-containing protein [Chloroflexi bacterium]|nr:DUF922 domain-containing protein [Chloroflexota bacterium]
MTHRLRSLVVAALAASLLWSSGSSSAVTARHSQAPAQGNDDLSPPQDQHGSAGAAVSGARTLLVPEEIALLTGPAHPASTSAALPSNITLSSHRVQYDVDGVDTSSILASIRAHGPHDGDGQWAAATTWTFRWTYRPAVDQSGCRATSATVDLELMYTYPRWTGLDGADRALAGAWERYIGAIDYHEQGHGQIAAQAARELARTIETLPPAASCQDLDIAVRAATGDLLARHAAAQAQYDQRTQHGVTQGATLVSGVPAIPSPRAAA